MLPTFATLIIIFALWEIWRGLLWCIRRLIRR